MMSNINRTYVFLIVALATLGAVSLCLFLYAGGSFRDNILPELIGFSLEGIFFVILFTIYEKYREQRSRLREKESLKKSLRSFLSLLLYWACPVDSKLTADFAFATPASLSKLITDLKCQGGFGDVQALFLKDIAKREASSFEAMLPVAAAVGCRYLEVWNRIINNLKGIRDSSTESECYDALIQLLNFLSEFDDLTIEV